MKTKGRQKKQVITEGPPEERAGAEGAEMSQRHPTPRCFAQRVRKILKTNEANVEKSAKREKESARV